MPRALSRVTLFVAIAVALTVPWSPPLENALAADTPNAPAVRADGAPRVRVRIGTYDGRAIAVAFAPSPTHNARIAELMKQAKDAEAAGDTERVEELRAKGSALQTVRHL